MAELVIWSVEIYARFRDNPGKVYHFYDRKFDTEGSIPIYMPFDWDSCASGLILDYLNKHCDGNGDIDYDIKVVYVYGLKTVFWKGIRELPIQELIQIPVDDQLRKIAKDYIFYST